METPKSSQMAMIAMVLVASISMANCIIPGLGPILGPIVGPILGPLGPILGPIIPRSPPPSVPGRPILPPIQIPGVPSIPILPPLPSIPVLPPLPSIPVLPPLPSVTPPAPTIVILGILTCAVNISQPTNSVNVSVILSCDGGRTALGPTVMVDPTTGVFDIRIPANLSSLLNLTSCAVFLKSPIANCGLIPVGQILRAPLLLIQPILGGLFQILLATQFILAPIISIA